MGHGQVASKTVVGIVTPDEPNLNVDRAVDTALARALLEEAGYADGLTTSLFVPAGLA